jgi:hypothetical protein
MHVRVLVPCILAILTQTAPSRVLVLRSTGGLPAHIAGSFQKPLGFQQSDAGLYFVFDRRAHAVFTIAGDAAKKIIEVGAEKGRVIDPSAFDISPRDGSFVIADAPLRQQRIQTFTASGGRIGGFTLPSREVARITLDSLVLNGVGSIQFTGETVLINQPESGVLVSELSLYGEPRRSFGQLRATGQESDPNVHLALNAGLPLIDPSGGFYFVFVAGAPMFRKYDAKGTLLFERHIEGPELDEYLKSMPTQWPSRRNDDGDLLPLVPPAVRSAGVDREGRLWISLMQPYTYVYDPAGEKIRTVQFRGADVLAPGSLFFTKDGRILVTPGCYEFRVPSLSGLP